MYAKQIRAPLTWKEPAIRDFSDLLYTFREIELDCHDPDFLSMVRAKLEVPGSALVDVNFPLASKTTPTII